MRCRTQPATSSAAEADLGLRGAQKLHIKAGRAIEITLALRRLELTQAAAAQSMGITQPKVSDIMRGEFSNLSDRAARS